MDKETANETAKPKTVNPEAIADFRAQHDAILQATVARALERSDQVEHHGDEAKRLITAGMEFTLKMLETAMTFGETAILDDEVKWAGDRLPHDGVLPEHVITRFGFLEQVMEEILTPVSAAQIVPYVTWMKDRYTPS